MDMNEVNMFDGDLKSIPTTITAGNVPIEDKKEKPDMVNHPAHYKSKKGIEVIDAIEAFTEDLVGIEAVYTGNIIKYVCRYPKKNGLQDLQKARWYLDKLIQKKEKEMPNRETLNG